MPGNDTGRGDFPGLCRQFRKESPYQPVQIPATAREYGGETFFHTPVFQRIEDISGNCVQLRVTEGGKVRMPDMGGFMIHIPANQSQPFVIAVYRQRWQMNGLSVGAGLTAADEYRDAVAAGQNGSQ